MKIVLIMSHTEKCLAALGATNYATSWALNLESCWKTFAIITVTPLLWYLRLGISNVGNILQNLAALLAAGKDSM